MRKRSADFCRRLKCYGFSTHFEWIQAMNSERYSRRSRWQPSGGVGCPSAWGPSACGGGRRSVFHHAATLAALAIGVSVVVSLLAAGVADAAETAKGRPLPRFETVRQVVLRELVNPPARIPGDIIARSEVKPVFHQLRLMGWPVLDEKIILKQVPGDTDFVVRQLRTPQGRSFMRKVARYPQVYDRLYRLASLPNGRQTVNRLIRSKGGEQFLAYLTKSRGGKNMGKMLQATPRGANFNRPTGKIFTVDALIKRLKESYTAEQQRRGEMPADGQR